MEIEIVLLFLIQTKQMKILEFTIKDIVIVFSILK